MFYTKVYRLLQISIAKIKLLTNTNNLYGTDKLSILLKFEMVDITAGYSRLKNKTKSIYSNPTSKIRVQVTVYKKKKNANIVMRARIIKGLKI